MECLVCNFKFKNNLSKYRHIQYAHHITPLEYLMRYENFEIPKCVVCNKNAKHNNGNKFYKTCCSNSCKSKIFKNKRLSESTKKLISHKRKLFLNENPDKHPWKNNEKFKSKPCEYLKNILTKNNIRYIEEVKISNTRNYSVDILIPDKNLIIEVNGNQHYDKNGKLKEYYQNRHDYIKSKGFNIIEIPYYSVFNENFIKDIIAYKNTNIIIPFFKRENSILKSRSKEEYFNELKHKNDILAKPIISNIKNSKIDFSKIGWVKEASLIIGIKPQKVNKWMKRHMSEFYNKFCYKRL